jgi:hypothetical protein
MSEDNTFSPDIRGPHEIIAENDGKTPWLRIEGIKARGESMWSFSFDCNNPGIKINSSFGGSFTVALRGLIDFLDRLATHELEDLMYKQGPDVTKYDVLVNKLGVPEVIIKPEEGL